MHMGLKSIMKTKEIVNPKKIVARIENKNKVEMVQKNGDLHKVN